jgi:hypothetical protein
VRILGLVFAGSATPHREAMTTFLRDVLTLPETDAAGTSATMFGLPDGARVAVADERDPGAGTSRTIGFEVADAAGAAAELAAAGADVDELQSNDAYRYVHVTAPDGRLYELVERVDARSRELAGLLAGLEPRRRAGAYVAVSVPELPAGDLDVQATVREPEGLTVVLPQAQADAAGYGYELALGWITLHVRSSFAAVGLTARVSTALAAAGISCNVLAGFDHDHLLVPLDRADEALEVLTGLGRQ